MKNLLTVVLVSSLAVTGLVSPAFADTANTAPYMCESAAAGLTLTIWKDEKGALSNALIERASEGFGHYMACWDAPSDHAPVFGDCYGIRASIAVPTIATQDS